MRGRSVALAALLVGYSATAGWAVPGRRHPIVQAALGTALAGLGGARPSAERTGWRSGARFGAVSAALVIAGVAVGARIPAVRAGMAARVLPQPAWKWLLIDIPVGTVWAEETAFRGALGAAAAAGFGVRRGRLLQAAAFGLSHVVDARGAGEPVAATVAVTGVAGWLFGWLATCSGSMLAPALAHLAVNEAGAVAALLVQRSARAVEDTTGVRHRSG